ncbi:GNAT family N-acetyltransferase [Flagellimonas lutaonensis]|jgi:GNAT superfamily N-acetyltransferase|uniref:GCN5-related N-acetyltransferase n=1 Tax=Flagellimonas lutaonensis TaxID=516051 RepID=A0A0D5YTR1_9FLAO|nr:GNAT family N-acetyltransferase [Allomuricauda lutaonensis]AKA35284.1 GCN5-related N-acetyltransferase [Allomuricauda lutaonensis]
MNVEIRNARPEDMAAVLRLVKELAIFEKEPEAVEVTEADLVRDGFGEKKHFHCFVAESDGNIVGLALVYERYSTWKGPVIHLEDLIVNEKARGQGVGKALLTAVVKYGHDLGVKRISWEVLDWNEPAIKFYETNGAKVMRDWDVVHLDEKGIKRYLERNN